MRNDGYINYKIHYYKIYIALNIMKNILKRLTWDILLTLVLYSLTLFLPKKLRCYNIR